MTKKIIISLLLLAIALCLTGCQTMEGLGKDVQWTGESIQKTASHKL
jgi:predicted small secreted protein